MGGAVASWLVRSSPDQVVQVRALAGDMVLCPWARQFTFTVPLSTQVYKWVLVNLMLGVTLRWTSIPSRGEGGVEILLVASCYRNRDKLQPGRSLGLYADFSIPIKMLWRRVEFIFIPMTKRYQFSQTSHSCYKHYKHWNTSF